MFLKNEKFVNMYLEFYSARENSGAENKLKKLKNEFVPKLIEALGNTDEKILIITEGDCLESNTKILILKNEKLIDKEIKNVNVNDVVLTHKGNFKRVIAKTIKEKESFKIKLKSGEEIISSLEHKFYVYNIQTNKFSFKRLKDINKNIHKLVKMKLN
jgi:hypothetical protein